MAHIYKKQRVSRSRSIGRQGNYAALGQDMAKVELDLPMLSTYPQGLSDQPLPRAAVPQITDVALTTVFNVVFAGPSSTFADVNLPSLPTAAVLVSIASLDAVVTLPAFSSGSELPLPTSLPTSVELAGPGSSLPNIGGGGSIPGLGGSSSLPDIGGASIFPAITGPPSGQLPTIPLTIAPSSATDTASLPLITTTATTNGSSPGGMLGTPALAGHSSLNLTLTQFSNSSTSAPFIPATLILQTTTLGTLGSSSTAGAFGTYTTTQTAATAGVQTGAAGMPGGSGGTGATPPGSSPSSTAAAGGLVANKSVTVPVVGGVVGGVAGLAFIAFIILFFLRRHNQRLGGSRRLRDTDTETAPPSTAQSAVPEMSQQAANFTTHSWPVAPFFRSIRPVSGQTMATTSSTTPSERGFQNLGGRKIQSVLLSGGDGYGGGQAAAAGAAGTRGVDSSHLSGTSWYRESADGAPAGTSMLVGPGTPRAPGTASERGSEVINYRPSPARSVTLSPGGPYTPNTVVPPPPPLRPDLLGRSHPSFDGSRGSKFSEDLR